MTAPRHPDQRADRSADMPIYSIGAVAKMLEVESATLRSWEERYGVVVPARSAGAQRVYSRDQVQQLRFIIERVAEGVSAADAHRLLEQQLGTSSGIDMPNDAAPVVLILLAERDHNSAELCEYFLRTEGYDVCCALDPKTVEALYVERRPDLSVVELMISGGLALCERLAADEGGPVLAVSPLPLRDQALAAGASAFLAKPFDPLQFVSTVRDLLGDSALTRHDRVPVA